MVRVFSPCSGSGPWVHADLENGLFAGANGSDLNNKGNSSAFVTAMVKSNGKTPPEWSPSKTFTFGKATLGLIGFSNDDIPELTRPSSLGPFHITDSTAAVALGDITSERAVLAVQGPNARAKLWQALPGSEAVSAALTPFMGVAMGEFFIARTGYTGEDGFEIMVPAAQAVAMWNMLVRAGVRPCGLGARDTLRLEAGMNLYGQDMDEAVTPLD